MAEDNGGRNIFARFFSALARTKKIESKPKDALLTQLRRCLSTFDITLLGIATTLGSGVYILTGEISHHTGPSILVSISLAAFASILCGLCYTEFAARVPKAGSAYVYSYAVIGEFCAFVVGWNLILEYGIGTAAVVKGLTQYADALLDGRLTHFNELAGKYVILGEEITFDIFSCILCLLLTGSVGIGVKASSYMNSFCTVVNIIVIIMFIAMGSFYCKVERLTDFAPHGATSIIAGASSCFYAFIGFDAVCMVAEEARKPNKSIPFAVVTTILICYFGFMGVALVLNMMISYKDMKGSSALATAFKIVNLPFGQYCIGVGAICGLLGNAITSMMMMPRFLYSMASDGIIFGFFAMVDSRFNIPLISTILSGILIGGMCLFLDLHMLVQMVSIGTILAYTLVTLSILILRYKAESLGMIRARTKSILSGISISYDGAIVVNPQLLQDEMEDELKQNQQREEKISPDENVERHNTQSEQAPLDSTLLHTPTVPNQSQASTTNTTILDQSQASTGTSTSILKQSHDVPNPFSIRNRNIANTTKGSCNTSEIIKEPSTNDSQQSNDVDTNEKDLINGCYDDDIDLLSNPDNSLDYSLFASLYMCQSNSFPNETTQFIATMCCVLIFMEILVLAAILQFAIHLIIKGDILVIIIFGFLLICLLITTLVLSKQPENSQRLFFKVPFLPWLPVFGLFLNVYLMFGLNKQTWIRFGIWMAIGLVIYFGYGFRHSRQRENYQIQTNGIDNHVDRTSYQEAGTEHQIAT